MKRLLPAALVLVVLLAGCVGPLQTGTDGERAGDGSTIAVSATGTASAEADLAVVSLGVEVTAESANAAREGVARGVNGVRSALADADIPDASVTTTAFGIAPVYDYHDGERELRGYRAVQSLAVETEPARAGEIVDLAVGAGATNVDGVRFTLSDERRAELRATALDRAMGAARTDADGIASAADLSVTGVRHASTGAAFDPVPVARFEDTAAGETTFQPAPVTVTAAVDVTYAAA
ncbi:SIMPL domain-containing protein [Haloplanus litoreus]|uniref:SIMPL domain-containing protein n=3 Tax=Haloplanus litoreus TaxID=767515 RepID=A0ABD6A202_9EURY